MNSLTQFLLKIGTIAKEMFFLHSGEVDIISVNFARLDREKAGAVFGELALVYSIPRTATVKAATDVEVWVLEKEGMASRFFRGRKC